MQERSISPGHWRFEWPSSAGTRRSGKSLRLWSERRSLARRFKESRTGLAGYLVYFALAAAGITFLITHNTRSTISVVIVAGACGIAAGTPLAILGAIGRAAQDGVIIKGGLYLERLAEVDTVLLDKTGTLTYGLPEVIEIRTAGTVSARSLLEAAAIAESQSEHPVAKAILNKASQMGIRVRQPERFEYTPGRGIVAEIDGEEIMVGSWMHLQDEGIKGAAQRNRAQMEACL